MSDVEHPDAPPDAADLLALEAEIPVLSGVRAFVDGAKRARWFAALGEPHSRQVTLIARAYLDALGYPHADAVSVLNWDDALAAAASLDLNTEGWEAEEQLRAGLTEQALTGISQEGMGVMLAYLSAALVPVLAELAEEAAYMADAPENLVDLMVGAGQQAAFGAAWVLAAAAVEAAHNDNMELDLGASAHPLLLKYRLFEAGHWPLALAGRTLNLF